MSGYLIPGPVFSDHPVEWTVEGILKGGGRGGVFPPRRPPSPESLPLRGLDEPGFGHLLCRSIRRCIASGEGAPFLWSVPGNPHRSAVSFFCVHIRIGIPVGYISECGRGRSVPNGAVKWDCPENWCIGCFCAVHCRFADFVHERFQTKNNSHIIDSHQGILQSAAAPSPFGNIPDILEIPAGGTYCSPDR